MSEWDFAIKKVHERIRKKGRKIELVELILLETHGQDFVIKRDSEFWDFVHGPTEQELQVKLLQLKRLR